MSDHMKRLAMPRAWGIPKKTHVWATKQNAGGHSVEDSMPVTIVLRDMLKVCDTAREAHKIVANRDVFVNGKKVKDPKMPVGIMDVITIPKTGTYCRMLLNNKGKLTVVSIPEPNSHWIMCKVRGKTIVSGGKFQLNLSGGRNVLLNANAYHTGDSVKLNLDSNEIIGGYPLAEGAVALVTAGRHSGKILTVKEYIEVKNPKSNIVTFQSGEETVKDNVFVIGTGKPEIIIPGASE